MADQGSTHTALELLAEYNDHRSQRDKEIDYIERRTFSEDTRPSYDELFKENVKLKLQINEQETEIDGLKKLIKGLTDNKALKLYSTVEQVVNQDDSDVNTELILPPRSADRKRNAKNLNIPIPEMNYHNSIPTVPHIDVTSNNTSEEEKEEALDSYSKPIDDVTSPESSNVIPVSSQVNISPAASVTYTTSRITIASPHSSRSSLVQGRVRSPQSANRVAAVINNQLHSPLRSDLCRDSNFILTGNFTNRPSPSTALEKQKTESPQSNVGALRISNKATDFSPSSKQNLNNFADFLDDTFGEEAENLKSNATPEGIQPPPPPPSFTPLSRDRGTPTSIKLGSPVILNRREHASEKEISAGKSSLNSSVSSVHASEALTDLDGKQKASSESLLVRSAGTASALCSQTGANLEVKRPRVTSISTQHSTTQSLTSEIPLFVQPEEFGSIRMEVLSSLYHEGESSYDHPHLLFSVIDRKSGKEMFKFSKSLQKLYELDSYLKPKVPTLSLPTLPDRQLFESLVPTKVDLRRERLNQYFRSIFSVPKFPPNVGLKIAQFISTDTVMNPVMLGDTVKEGPLLMRRAKALGNGFNWRSRYGVLGGEILQLYDRRQPTETIRLRQSTIELLPNLPEDRYGTKNGFVINEHKKSGLSSSTKYYLCAETSREREIWVSVLSEYFVNPMIPPSSSIGSLSTGVENGASYSKNETGNGVDQIYVTDLTSNSTHNESTNSSPHEADESIEYDKDTRRLKMRSFFPFKKLTSNALSMVYDDAETTVSQESELKFSDNSVAKSLENMNLSTDASLNSVFGSPLEKCLQLSSHNYQGTYDIPSVVYRCLEFLYKNHGVQEEGIFRLSGSSVLIKSLQEQFDREHDVDLSQYNNTVADANNGSTGTYIDVNTVSGLLKLYLRKLPHLIFGEDEYTSFKGVVDKNHDNPAQVAIEFKGLVRSGVVRQANISLMYALFELLVRIRENSRYNKMNLRNLCIVFSPTLNIPVTILQPLIIDFACIFQDAAPVSQSEREKIDIHIPQV